MISERDSEVEDNKCEKYGEVDRKRSESRRRSERRSNLGGAKGGVKVLD